MALEDLNFRIKADAADAMQPLLKLNDALTVTTGLFDRVSNRFATLPTITQQSTSQMTGLQTQVANTDRAFGELVKNAVYFEDGETGQRRCAQESHWHNDAVAD